MRDQQLRDMLEKGGVIFQKGDRSVADGCKDFDNLWGIALDNARKLDMLIAHLGLEVVTGVRIQKKETPNAQVEADGAASCAGRASNDGLGRW